MRASLDLTSAQMGAPVRASARAGGDIATLYGANHLDSEVAEGVGRFACREPDEVVNRRRMINDDLENCARTRLNFIPSRTADL